MGRTSPQSAGNLGSPPKASPSRPVLERLSSWGASDGHRSTSSTHMSFRKFSPKSCQRHAESPLRVCHENVHAVFRIFLIFALCLEHESLEYVIISRDDAAHKNQQKKKNVIERGFGASPNFESRIVAIVLVPTSASYLRCGVVRYLPFWDVP